MTAAEHQTPYDLAVVGVDPLGIAIAREAAVRGLRVVAFGSDDVAADVAPGGWPIGLGERDPSALLEQSHASQLEAVAPHLLRRFPAVTLSLRGRVTGGFRITAALVARRAYERSQTVAPDRSAERIDAATVRELLPALSTAPAGAMMHAGWTLDALRFCVGLMVDAQVCGASIRTRVEHELSRGEDDGPFVIEGRFRATGHPTSARSRALVLTEAGVDARGLGIEPVTVRPERVAALTFERRFCEAIVALPEERIVIVPDRDTTLVLGRSSADPRKTLESVRGVVARIFPVADRIPVIELRVDDRFGVNAAPTVADHREDGARSVWSAAGAGPAAVLDAAHAIVDLVGEELGVAPVVGAVHRPLLGAVKTERMRALSERYGVPEPVLHRLVGRYGGRVHDVLARLKKNPEQRAAVCPCEGVLECEVVHACAHEAAATLADVSRRTDLGRGPCGAMRCAHRGAQVASRVLGGAPEQVWIQATDLLRDRAAFQAPALEGPLLRQHALLTSYLAGAGAAPHRGTGEEPG